MALTLTLELKQEMDISPELASGSLCLNDIDERRKKPRLSEPFLVRVRGVNTNSEPFEVETTLDDLSAGGLFLRMSHEVEPGARIFIIIRLSVCSCDKATAPSVATVGKVKRVEPQSDGIWGLAVEFSRHRFI